jgi:hypothetical protein
MKFQVVLPGVLFCLAAAAGNKPSQVDAPAMNQSAPTAQGALTGCIDEQDGHYVLLDDHMVKITNLQSAGSDKEVFAKHVGRMVRVRGTKSSGLTGTFKVTGIERLEGNCGEVK